MKISLLIYKTQSVSACYQSLHFTLCHFVVLLPTYCHYCILQHPHSFFFLSVSGVLDSECLYSLVGWYS